jgi:hypothetical protein
MPVKVHLQHGSNAYSVLVRNAEGYRPLRKAIKMDLKNVVYEQCRHWLKKDSNGLDL